MKKVILTDEQSRTCAGLQATLKAKQQTITTVHGVAGVGKTTVLGAVNDVSDETNHVCCFSAKAAKNARAKGALNATTIHALIYKLKYQHVKDDGTVDLYFDPKQMDGALSGHKILLDECSMISTDIAIDLIRTGAHIVAFGDPMQLPPVKGEQYFRVPDFSLTEIHRQALDSPIIRQAHQIRLNCNYESDGNDFTVVDYGRISTDALVDADMVLCYMRRTVDKMNQRIRKAKGYTMPYPVKGEKVLCFKNASEHKVWNGGIYTLTADFPHVEGTMRLLDEDGKELTVPGVLFTPTIDKVGLQEDCVSQFGFAQAMTVHKAQGSEWDKLVLFDECRQPIRRQFLYTGVTRAAKAITVERGFRI